MDALDPLELDVRRRARAGDERERPALGGRRRERGDRVRAPRRGSAPPRRGRRGSRARASARGARSARRRRARRVPVSAIASAQPVRTPSSWSSAARGDRRVVDQRARARAGGAGRPAGRRAGARPARGTRATTASSSSPAATRRTVAWYSRGALAEARDDRLAAGRRAAPGEVVVARDLGHGRRRARARLARCGRGSPSRALRASRARAHQSRNDCFGHVGQLAHRRPARQRAGQLRDRAVAGARHPLRALVAPARAEHARQRVHRQPLGAPARLDLAHDPPAQVHEHGRDVDLDRADLVARAAQRGRPRQRRRVRRAPRAAG